MSGVLAVRLSVGDGGLKAAASLAAGLATVLLVRWYRSLRARTPAPPHARVVLDASDAPDADVIAACVREHGVCCVRGFFGAAQVKQWAAELRSLRVQGKMTSARNRNAGRCEYNFDPQLPPFGGGGNGTLLADARLVYIFKRLLGAKVRVETAGSVLAEPGAVAQRWHQDVPHLFTTGTHLPVHFLAAFVPLCEITPANGPTEFRIGSHVKANVVRSPEELALACPVGSLVLFDGRVFHRGGRNSSSTEREVLFLNVCRHWFRDMSNKVEHRLELLL